MLFPQKWRGRTGFTLIETMLYAILVTIVLSGFLMIVQATLHTQRQFKTRALLHETVRFTLHKLESRIQAASGITSPLPGATSTILILAMSEPSRHPTTLEMRNGVLFLTEGAGPETSLTGERTELTQFIVTHVGTTPPSLRLVLTAETRTSASGTGDSFTIQETISLRR